MELKCSKGSYSLLSDTLLIVPYGIEIKFRQKTKFFVLLLIVPYGIEMKIDAYMQAWSKTFNRTLWN